MHAVKLPTVFTMRDNAQELNMNWRERLPSSVDDRLWHIPAPSGVSGPFGFGIVEPVSPISAAALAVNNGAGRPRRQQGRSYHSDGLLASELGIRSQFAVRGGAGDVAHGSAITAPAGDCVNGPHALPAAFTVLPAGSGAVAVRTAKRRQPIGLTAFGWLRG